MGQIIYAQHMPLAIKGVMIGFLLYVCIYDYAKIESKVSDYCFYVALFTIDLQDTIILNKP